MNREIHKITLTDISGEKLMKAVDIISAALVAQFHKNIIVVQEGHYTQTAIDSLPPSTTVFMICIKNTEPFCVEDKSEFMRADDLAAITVDEIN